jgi:hypothetical protein
MILTGAQLKTKIAEDLSAAGVFADKSYTFRDETKDLTFTADIIRGPKKAKPAGIPMKVSRKRCEAQRTSNTIRLVLDLIPPFAEHIDETGRHESPGT